MSVLAATDRGGRIEESDDEVLARAATHGDREAFAELYRRHAPAVLSAIRDNVRDLESRRDVVQDTFTRALARLDTLARPSSFRPWVLQIARHAAIDHRRHSRLLSFDGLDDQAQPTPAVEPGPDLVAETRDLARHVRRGLAALSPRDATAVALAADHGYGPAEIGAALEITAGHAKVVLHRARRRLRAAVRPHTV